MGTFIIGGVVVVLLLMFIIFPEVRKKLKVLVGGFLNIFVEDVAKTPEGAKAVYQQAIEEAEEDYNKASQVLHRFAGELDRKIHQISEIERKIVDVEAKCEACVRSGKVEDAKIFAEQRAAYVAELDNLIAYRQQLEPMVAEARGAHELYGKKLKQLKVESKRVVDEMQLSKSMNALLADLDELRTSGATDKLLGAVRDGADDLRKEVRGGMVVHQNRLSTKVAKAETAASQSQSDAYLQSLLDKYQSKPALGTGSGTAIPLNTQTPNKQKVERK